MLRAEPGGGVGECLKTLDTGDTRHICMELWK